MAQTPPSQAESMSHGRSTTLVETACGPGRRRGACWGEGQEEMGWGRQIGLPVSPVRLITCGPRARHYLDHVNNEMGFGSIPIFMKEPSVTLGPSLGIIPAAACPRPSRSSCVSRPSCTSCISCSYFTGSDLKFSS